MSPLDEARIIVIFVETEGSKALTVGLGSTVFGYDLEAALKFGAYEN